LISSYLDIRKSFVPFHSFFWHSFIPFLLYTLLNRFFFFLVILFIQ
jgi:hypothetical protein